LNRAGRAQRHGGTCTQHIQAVGPARLGSACHGAIQVKLTGSQSSSSHSYSRTLPASPRTAAAEYSTLVGVLKLPYSKVECPHISPPVFGGGYYYLKLKYPIHSVHLSIDPTTKQLEFITNTDYFDFESNIRRTLNPKFDANGVDSEGSLFIDISTRKLRAKYNDTLQVNASKELGTSFNCVGLKTNGGLSLDATTKLLQYNLNPLF
jgi:hypothetical protein